MKSVTARRAQKARLLHALMPQYSIVRPSKLLRQTRRCANLWLSACQGRNVAPTRRASMPRPAHGHASTLYIVHSVPLGSSNSRGRRQLIETPAQSSHAPHELTRRAGPSARRKVHPAHRSRGPHPPLASRRKMRGLDAVSRRRLELLEHRLPACCARWNSARNTHASSAGQYSVLISCTNPRRSPVRQSPAS